MLNDLRYAVRMLAKNAGFSIVAVVTLALGIGANTAIFSIVNAILLRVPPYKESNQLVRVLETTPQGTPEGVSLPNFVDWKDETRTFESLSAFVIKGFDLTGAGAPQWAAGARVSSNLFTLLGVQPALGRAFLPEEEKPGRNEVVVISHSLWQGRFGSDPDIVGKTLALDGKPHIVVGVMPRDFRFPLEAHQVELWVPFETENPTDRGAHDFFVIARLKASLERARAEMDTIALRLQRQYPETNKNWGVKVVPLQEHIVGNTRPALLVLLGAVGFLLLIACSNVANLLLARAAGRRREVAVRTALGATRLRLVRLLLTESTLLAFLAGTLGLALALSGIQVLVALSPQAIPRLEEVGLDGRVLGFTFVVTLFTGVAFGLIPALHTTKTNLNESLKEGGRSATEGIGHNRIRSLLVISEVAATLVLLIGAALMTKSLVRLWEVDPGFNPDMLLTMQLTLPEFKYPEGYQRGGFQQHVLARIRTLPGVESAGAVSPLPLSEGFTVSITIEGRALSSVAEGPSAFWHTISPNYFRTMGIPLLKGCDFTEQDKAGAPEVVIVNEKMAEMFWPGEDPIGKRITISDAPNRPWRSIVGVVGNTKREGLDAQSVPEMYVAYLQRPAGSMTLVVRSASNPKSLAAAVRSEVWQVDKDQPLYNVRTMEEILSSSLAARRFNMLLLGIFSLVALLLAGVGIYGVAAYSVTERTHEIGIRMALGAQAGDVLKLVVHHGVILTVIGLAIGLVAALGLTRLMGSLLYGVGTTDPATFAAVSSLLTAVSLLASYIPARRATKVDPTVALRYE